MNSDFQNFVIPKLKEEFNINLIDGFAMREQSGVHYGEKDFFYSIGNYVELWKSYDSKNGYSRRVQEIPDENRNQFILDEFRNWLKIHFSDKER